MKQKDRRNHSMKKIVIGVLAAAVILAAGSFSAFAAGPGGGRACGGGICDYAGEVCHDSNGDGHHHRASGHHAPAGRGSLRHGHHGGHCR